MTQFPLTNKFSSVRRANINKYKLKLKGKLPMPKLTASKEDVKVPPVPGSGIYTVRLKGFKPDFAKKRDSVNLNPQLEIINHPEFNNVPLFESMSTKAKWAWAAIFACFGCPVTKGPDGEFDMPGEFTGPENNPKAWTYVGPLLGQEGQVEVVEEAILNRDTGLPGEDKYGRNTQARIKKYLPRA
jgi:hypothetical protein